MKSVLWTKSPVVTHQLAFFWSFHLISDSNAIAFLLTTVRFCTNGEDL